MVVAWELLLTHHQLFNMFQELLGDPLKKKNVEPSRAYSFNFEEQPCQRATVTQPIATARSGNKRQKSKITIVLRQYTGQVVPFFFCHGPHQTPPYPDLSPGNLAWHRRPAAMAERFQTNKRTWTPSWLPVQSLQPTAHPRDAQNKVWCSECSRVNGS